MLLNIIYKDYDYKQDGLFDWTVFVRHRVYYVPMKIRREWILPSDIQLNGFLPEAIEFSHVDNLHSLSPLVGWSLETVEKQRLKCLR